MKVVAITFVYNELRYLPAAIAYYKKQGCDIYVIDNMSTDGTWEWLQENKISSHQFDTDEAFQLDWLQAEMLKTIHSIKPDWFLWFSPDLYITFENTIHDTIGGAAKNGFNQITYPCYCFKNTGEIKNQILYDEIVMSDMFDLFHFAKMVNTLLISKYDEALQIGGDSIFIPDFNILTIGVIVEYGLCKEIKVQETKLQRRTKAWEKKGLPSNYGEHYLIGKNNNWIFDRSTLIDVRQIEEVQNAISILKKCFYDN